MSGATRPTPTDFVQDYAAKRQAQMERARKMREDRQQQLDASKLSVSNTGHDTTVENGTLRAVEVKNYRYDGNTDSNIAISQTQAPRIAAGAASNTLSRHILYVVEEDFTRATQAGIITPDQARQLWAMFSNQIIRVGGMPVDAVVSIHSLKLLSQRSSSSNSDTSTRLSGGSGSATGISSPSGNGFGGSISMESLRQSIAQFKEDQAHHRQQKIECASYAGAERKHGSPGRVAQAQLRGGRMDAEDDGERHRSYLDEEDATGTRRRSMHGDDEQDTYPSHKSHHNSSSNPHPEYDLTATAMQKGSENNNKARVGGAKKTTTGGRPAWNFDTTAQYNDGYVEQQKEQSKQGNTSSREMYKRNNTNHNKNSSSATVEVSRADTHASSSSSRRTGARSTATVTTSHHQRTSNATKSLVQASPPFDLALSAAQDSYIDGHSVADSSDSNYRSENGSSLVSTGQQASKPSISRAAKFTDRVVASTQDAVKSPLSKHRKKSAVNESHSSASHNLDDVQVGSTRTAAEHPWRNAYPGGNDNSKKEKQSQQHGHDESNVGSASGSSALDVNKMIEREAKLADQEPLRACSSCGRTFRESVLARHEQVCRKQSSKPRKLFDMRHHRLEGIDDGAALTMRRDEGRGSVGKSLTKRRAGGGISEGAKTIMAAETTAASSSSVATAAKLPKWKIQHEQFQAAMRAAHQQTRLEQQGGSGGGGFGSGHLPAPPAPLPEEYDTRIPCPHCGRKFAEETAQRHIPKCATTIAKPKGLRPRR